MATENIVVAVRMRPLIPREKEEKTEIYWKAEPPTTICQINTSEKPVAYSFDHVFDSKVENEYIYREICSGIVKSVVDGFNGTIFAYGQTSSGKTFTMLGDKEKNVRGIMHYAIEDLFELIQNMTDREFLLRVSYMEIYNETIRDLFSGKEDLKLQDKNGQFEVKCLQEKIVQKPEQILHFMEKGERNRTTGETKMNEKSSRSHAIFRMIIESCVRGEENAPVNVSQFNLVDLAGSERARHTGATGTRFKESVKINQSLLSLGQVIRQLSENEKQYISYRDSNLTKILKNSLGGNSLTAIICTASAACFDETLSTLKFADQAKRIRNEPQVNEVITEQALIKKYANEIKKLTEELEATKEEKSQQNRHLQEKIKYLEKQFVLQMNPMTVLKAKSNRRETWGGALDAARFRLPFASQDSFKNRKSFTRSQVGSCNLSILEEQCEDADGDETFFPHLTTKQLKGSKRSSNFNQISNLHLTADVAVQVEPVAQCFPPKVPESEHKMKRMAERISDLEKELAELREFTTLERQIMESCSSSIDVCKVKDTISASDEGLRSRSECFSNFDLSIFEEIEHKNIETEDSIFSPCDTSRIRFNEKKEDLFQYLESTVKIMGMRKHIDFPSVADDLNNDCKITLEMFYLILQYQCLTFKGCFKTEICKKIDEVLCDLRDVFKSFSDQTISDETVENLIYNFMSRTDYLLKEIEMVSLDSDADDKNEIINERRPFDSITCLPSFEESPRLLPNKNEMGRKNSTENVKMSSSMYEDGNIEESMADPTCDCEKLRTKILTLEKDIKMYQDSVSIANSDKEELKDKIVALEKQIEIYQTSTFDLDSENKKIKDKIAFLEKDIEMHLKTISIANSNEVQLIDKIAVLEKRIEIYQTSTSDLDSENKKIKDKIACLEKDIELHLKNISIANSNKEELTDKIAYLEKQIEGYQTSTSDLDSENKKIKDKITCLEKDIEAHLKTISDYDYDSNLKDKQIAILKDKIEIQKQMIDSFENELTLKDKPECMCSLEVVSNMIPNNNSNSLITFKDQACQVAYMEGISLCSGLDESKLSERCASNLSTNSYHNCDRSLNESKVSVYEQNSEKVCQQTLQALPLTKSENENWTDELKTSFEATLKDLSELKMFTLEFMKKYMEEEYLLDMGSFDEQVNYPLIDQMKVEVTALKEILLRLEFYFYARSDVEKHRYDMKIEEMKFKFHAEKEEWASKRVKETEEKYYKMMMDQESKFLEEKHQTELDFYKQISDYEKKLADQFDQLQEENHNNVSDLKKKLDAEIEERYRERIKLEDKIRSREKDLTQYREYNSYLKSKCKELAVELKKRKEKAKSFEQRENVVLEQNSEKSVDCKETQTEDNRLEDSSCSSPNLCDQCKIFVLKLSDLEAIHQIAVKKSELSLAKLQNELEAKKAKIISLDTNNAKMVQEIVALKKELSTKSLLLRFCQCKGHEIKMAEAQSSGKLENIKKGKDINVNPENDKERLSDIRNNLTSQEILQMEIVQDAIKKAKEEEKELLLGGGAGSGPANSMQCYYLQAKLNKKSLELNRKNEELNSLKMEMAKLKKRPLNQGFEVINELSKDIKSVEGNIFTPYTNPKNPLPEGDALHLKMQRRKILKETNRKSIAPFPTSKEETKKERINDENFNPFNIPLSLEGLKTKNPTVPDKKQEDKDKAAETRREIELLFGGAPHWPWE